MGVPATSTGLIAATVSFISFSTSGVLVKPLLAAGWSPAAAVTARALAAGLVLLPFVVVSLRGRWDLLWRARWSVLGMGLAGVALTQVLYFAAIGRIPVATALLIEFLAPLILVGFTWAVSRRTPAPVVLVGSVLAVGGPRGQAYEPSPWEFWFAAERHRAAGDYDAMVDEIAGALERYPDHPAALYHLGRAEALAGRTDDAVAHVRRAVELRPEWADHIRQDEDLAALRAHPGWPL